MTRASLILFWFSLALFASVILYNTSYGVQELNQKLRATNAKIEAEQAALHVLKAEWVYLSTPARIEKQAIRHLKLRPTEIKQLAKLENLAAIMPTREETLAGLNPNKPRLQQASARPVETTVKQASAEPDHVNTRMIFQRSAEATPSNLKRHILLADFEPAPRAGRAR